MFILIIFTIILSLHQTFKKLNGREWIGVILSLLAGVAVGLGIIYFFGNWFLNHFDDGLYRTILSWVIVIVGIAIASYVFYRLSQKATGGKM